MAEFEAEQMRLLGRWEYAQTNDGSLLEDDPAKEEVKAAINLVETAPNKAFATLLELAKQGSLYSMNYVAWCCDNGAGTAKDTDQAEAWYRRAFEGGSERALLAYGAHLRARGQNSEAEKVYEAGWQRGFLPAVYRLIRLRLRPTLPMAERLAWQPALEWAAAAGHPAARYLLSKYLFRGWFGVRGIPRGVTLVTKHLAAIACGDGGRPIVT